MLGMSHFWDRLKYFQMTYNVILNIILYIIKGEKENILQWSHRLK